ncbi:MAG: S-layer homology domain-containing protein [Clostridiales bacterium]|nr:S-layer homology domain-containing protein [Clostridiales bacterium]
MKDQIRRLLLSSGIAAAAFIVAFSFGTVKADSSGEEQEPNDSFQEANFIEEGKEYSARISDPDEDYYKLTIPSSGLIFFDVDGVDLRWGGSISFYDSNYKTILSDHTLYYGHAAIKATPGTYYVRFDFTTNYPGDKSSNSYSFKYTFEASKEPFTNAVTYNMLADPATATIGNTYYSQIADNDEKDFYKIELMTDGQLTVKYNSNFNFCLDMLDENGQPVSEMRRISSGESNEVFELAAGTYYLCNEWGGSYFLSGTFSGSYSFSLSFYDPNTVTVSGSVNVVCGGNFSVNAAPLIGDGSYTWKSSDTKIVSVDSKGVFTGKMAGSATITITNGKKKLIQQVVVLYKDVTNSKDFWFAPTNYLTAKEVVKGYDKQTKFKPANDCTRSQMVTFLYRLAGQPKPKATTCKFKDVKKTDYFFKAVIWAVEEGITTGVSKTQFNPKGVCTRAQTVTFLWRMAKKPEPKTTKNPFPDVKKSDYFYKATLWASEKKILAGLPDGTFQPQGKCLRRQMVTFLYKYDKYVNGKG